MPPGEPPGPEPAGEDEPGTAETYILNTKSKISSARLLRRSGDEPVQPAGVCRGRQELLDQGYTLRHLQTVKVHEMAAPTRGRHILQLSTVKISEGSGKLPVV